MYSYTPAGYQRLNMKFSCLQGEGGEVWGVAYPCGAWHPQSTLLGRPWEQGIGAGFRGPQAFCRLCPWAQSCTIAVLLSPQRAGPLRVSQGGEFSRGGGEGRRGQEGGKRGRGGRKAVSNPRGSSRTGPTGLGQIPPWIQEPAGRDQEWPQGDRLDP